eukprot:jgi/Antlo1/850/1961
MSLQRSKSETFYCSRLQKAIEKETNVRQKGLARE